MKKSEILEVVKRMQKDWLDSVNNSEQVPVKCHLGFCYWFRYELPSYTSDDLFIISELKKDIKPLNKYWKKTHWYRTLFSAGKQALLPRLNHLNRTIARLENELKAQ